MAVAFVITVFAGFSRTYYLRPYFNTSGLPLLLHFHGLIFSSWLALLVTQTSLVAAKRTDIHRRLGIAGALIAVMMVAVGSFTAIFRAKIVEVPPGVASPLIFLTIPLGDMLVFAILVGAGFYLRRRVDAHKRLMLLATISILPAAIARLPFGFIQEVGGFLWSCRSVYCSLRGLRSYCARPASSGYSFGWTADSSVAPASVDDR
jgi:hypothetical protein